MNGSKDRGQILVLFVLALVVIIAGVGLVIDVGFAWSQQRHTQNGADAASEAGALVLARRSAEGPTSTLNDTDIRNAILSSLNANRLSLRLATYTTWQGDELSPQVTVGSLAGNAPPPDAAGVRVAASRNSRTFLSGVIGINQLTVVQEATAVSGPTTGCVETEEGCTFLPVTFPVNVFACTSNGKTQPIDPPQQWAVGEEIILPLCGGNPGSVGWLDWTPTEGGTSELEGVIRDPPPISIPVPSWQYVTETGDISAGTVEDALNIYAGEVVQVPMFSDTCADEPPDKEDSFCPSGSGTGQGQGQWYFITKILSFRLASPQGAFIQGGEPNEAICGTNAHECLIGSFVSFTTEGTVGPPCPVTGCPAGTGFAVQLYK